MTGNYVLHSIMLAVFFILLCGSVILYVVPTRKAFKLGSIDLNYIKKNKLWYVFSFLALIFASISFILQFYFNEYNFKYISESLLTTIDAWHYFLIFFGGIFSAISLFLFVSIFIFYFFFESSYKKDNKKKYLLMLFGSALFLIVFFIIYMEGNAPYLRYPFANRIYFGSSGIKLATVYTGYNWAPLPTNDSWGFSIAFYALCILSGALLVLVVCSHQLKVLYGQGGLITTLFLIAFPSGIIGARIWYVIGNWYRDGFDQNFMKIFAISDGGLAIMGGSLGIIVGLSYVLIMKYKLKKKPYNRMDLLMVIDIIVPTILLAQALGRWGNFFNNEVHGNLVDVNNFMWIPTFIRNNMAFSSAHRVSTLANALIKLNSGQIYLPLFYIESLINLLGYAVIGYLFRIGFKKISCVDSKGKRPWYKYIPYGVSASGSGVGWYLVWYGATRAILEPLRDSSFNMGTDDMWSVYSSYVMMGIGLIIIAFFIVWQVQRDHGKWIIKLKEDKVNKND